MTIREQLDHIAKAALRRSDPFRMVAQSLSLDRRGLRVQAGTVDRRIPLAGYSRILLIGAGKAAAPMAQAVEALLGERIDEGLIVVKEGHALPLERTRSIEGGHPLPDERSVRAAAELTALAEKADQRTLVINLVSGGASALLSSPVDLPEHRLSLADIQETTRLLLASGATIQEMNCLRRHLLLLAGGRLAERLFPATVVSLILSDVVGDALETIASGPTVPDPTTYAEALSIVERLGIGARLPTSVSGLLEAGARGELPDTPKPGVAVFTRGANLLIGTNALALAAARGAAEQLGYNVLVLTSRLVGEAREVAKVLAAVAAEVAVNGAPCRRPACLLAGGETTVTLRGSGTGGRNQELALAYLLELERSREALEASSLLSFSTDGEDGPTTAAGAFADRSALASAIGMGLSLSASLRENDSHSLFDRVGGLYVTGPTNTNVCDIQIILIP